MKEDRVETDRERTSAEPGRWRSPLTRRMAGIVGNRSDPRHTPVAPVLLEVICPFELNLIAFEHRAVALDAAHVREVSEANSSSVGSLDRGPSLLAMPERNGPVGHG